MTEGKKSSPSSERRSEYQARINRVVDHIEQNLAQELNLAALARVASFSQYHFHRIFGAMMGEPLNQYIKRIRLEKAAALLVRNPKRTITDVALDCGFSGSATFARAFKEAYDMSASQWRDGGYRTHCEADSAASPEALASSQAGGEIRLLPALDIEPGSGAQRWTLEVGHHGPVTIEVKELPEYHVAYVRHIGRYQGLSEVFMGMLDTLMKWAGPRDLMVPEAKVLSLYHDDPNLTDDARLRCEMCLTVPEGTPVEGEIGSMYVAGGKYAVGRFELADDEYPLAWYALMGVWLPESGYQPDDRLAYELYHNDCSQHPEGKAIVDICVPVVPL